MVVSIDIGWVVGVFLVQAIWIRFVLRGERGKSSHIPLRSCGDECLVLV